MDSLVRSLLQRDASYVVLGDNTLLRIGYYGVQSGGLN